MINEEEAEAIRVIYDQYVQSIWKTTVSARFPGRMGRIPCLTHI